MYSGDLNYYENPRPEMVKFLPKGTKKILDVGCGAGAFGKALKQVDSSLEVWGTDINQAAISFAEKNIDKALCVKPDSKLESLPEIFLMQFFSMMFWNTL